MNLKDKHIVITGGTSGIGLELVRRLYTNNKLIVISRSSASLAALQNEFPNLVVYQAELSNGDQVRACAEKIAQQYDRIDMLINNAAIQYTPKFIDTDFDFESIATEITVNLTSPCQLIAKLLPNLQKAPEALIINVNSGLGLVPKTSSAVYCATKGGLNIFSKALANQLEGTTVNVKQVFLPLVDTAMTRGRGSGKLTPGAAADQIIEGITGRRKQIDIGKVKLLRLLDRFTPSLARTIMKSA